MFKLNNRKTVSKKAELFVRLLQNQNPPWAGFTVERNLPRSCAATLQVGTTASPAVIWKLLIIV